ncbi:hypothetical protein [Vandammella animalimorsus]|uniref:hypothetical protein n=1 Tax=Vandammella animalimorsus TaxID=2029117 RepID=UPI001177564B|nr:hypothetical protein [Vandammella animalimorsus]
MKLTTKLALAAVASAFSMGAFADCAVGSGATEAGANGDKHVYAKPAADSTCYMQSGFESPVSANVHLKWIQTDTAVAVATSNKKGRNNYTGFSEGGRVAQCGDPTTGTTAPTTADPDMTKPNACGR